MNPTGRKWLLAALIAWGILAPAAGWWYGFKFGKAVTLAGWQKRADRLDGEIRRTGKKVKAAGRATGDAILTGSARLVRKTDALVSSTEKLLSRSKARLKRLLKHSDKETTK